jgi:hypothetical protein
MVLTKPKNPHSVAVVNFFKPKKGVVENKLVKL